MVEPHIAATVAADVEEIGSAISAANAAAAGRTSGLLAAAADEVSVAVTQLFGAYGREYQAVAAQAAAFRSEFARALAAAGNAYATAEGVNAASVGGTLGSLGTPSQLISAMVTPISADLTLFVGPTGNPTPNQTYITNANNLYVRSVNTLQALFSPEEGYPLTGVKSLTFDRSINEGVNILNSAILAQLQSPTDTLTIFGYSQSSIMSSLEMDKLAAMGAGAPGAGQLNFVLVGNEMNPNGGLLARFPGLTIPSLGLTFYGGTNANTIYPTNIYTLEYDGFADFPQYPLNLLADLNAVTGIATVHTTYLQLTPTQVDNAIHLTPSQGYSGVTNYYIIPTENLPILGGLRGIPIVGQPLADLIQPDLKVFVNLGYGNPDMGYSGGPPNVTTPFGFAPHVPASVVLGDLAVGTQQGIADFKADLANAFAQPVTFPNLAPPPLVTDLVGASPSPIAPTPLNIVNKFADIVSTDYAVLLPTADIALGLVTTVPAYDATLFVDQLLAGNVVNAITYPIAADVGLATVAAMTEFIAVAEAAVNNIRDIASILP